MELYEDLAVWAVLGMLSLFWMWNAFIDEHFKYSGFKLTCEFHSTGATTNGLARGIRNKPLSFRPLGYAYAAFIGIGIGLVADAARTQQNEFASKRLSALIAARQARESQE